MSQRMKNAIILIGLIVGTLILLSIIGSILYISLFTDKIVNLDITTIVSLILALFSIFISMMFYFKTTETSNQFYINSNSHMSRQSELLGRIEERFGEKLSNVEKILSHAQGIGSDAEKIAQELEVALQEKDELNKRISDMESTKGVERDELVKELDDKNRTIQDLLEENKNNSIQINNYLNQIRHMSDDNNLHNSNTQTSRMNSIFKQIYAVIWSYDIKIDDEFKRIFKGAFDPDAIGLYTKRSLKNKLFKEIQQWISSNNSISKSIEALILDKVKELIDQI